MGSRVLIVIGMMFGLMLGSTADAEDIKIGIIVPRTGAEASEGTQTLQAAELSVKEVNDAGGVNGQKFKLIIADSKSSPTGTIEAFSQLVEKDKVDVLIPPIKSAQIVTILPKIKEQKIPSFIGGTAARLTQDGGRWAYRMRPDDSIVALVMAKFIKEELKVKKVGILNDTSAFGKGGGDYAAKYLSDLGLELVKRVQFDPKDQQFNKYIAELKAAGTEAMITYLAGAEPVAKVQMAWNDAGRPFKFVGSPANATKLTLSMSKNASEGVYAIGDMIFGENDVIKAYNKNYEKQYGQPPDSIYSFSYDAIRVLAEALKKKPKGPEAIRDAVLATKNLPGLLGTISFDQEGNGLHEVNIAEIKSGKPVLIKTMSK